MDASPMDPAISSALEAILGHPAPFTPEECAAVKGPLVVRGARDLGFLEHLHALRHLELISSEARQLDVLAKLQELSTLKLVCTPITRLDALASCQKLENLELLFTSAEDLSPLLSMPSLRRARLLGNPWSPKSFASRQALWTRPVARWGRPPIIEMASAGSWELTRRLRSKGMKLDFAFIDHRDPLLARPGLAQLAGSDCDCVRVNSVLLEHKLLTTKGVTAEALLADFAKSGGVVGTSAFQSRRVLGSAEEALKWIESSVLPAEDKARFARFTRRFPWMTFYQQGTEQLDAAATEHRVTLPGWLRAQHEALAGFNPDCAFFVQFDGFDQGPYNEEKLLQGWYQLELMGYAGDEERGLLHDRLGLFPMAYWDDQNVSALGTSVTSPEDRAIYQYAQEYLWDAISEGTSLEERLTPVFESYASMLSHIKAVRLDDLDPIPAVDLES